MAFNLHIAEGQALSGFLRALKSVLSTEKQEKHRVPLQTCSLVSSWSRRVPCCAVFGALPTCTVQLPGSELHSVRC